MTAHSAGRTHGDGRTHAGHTSEVGRTFEQQQRRLTLATGLNIVIVAGQAAAGLLVGSVALLADAGHNLSDAAGVTFALIAVRLARRAPSATRTFGGLRWPVLAAQANAGGVLVITALLAFEAIGRLGEPAEVDGLVVAVVALIGAAVNALSALMVHERDGDLNTRAAVLHLAADAMVSIAVAAAGVVIWLAGGWYWLDPAVSIAVAVLIGFQGVRLLVQTSRVLLEATPAGLDLAAVRADVLAVDGVIDVHDMHVWGLSDRVSAASAHIEVVGHPTLEEAREVADRVKVVLAEKHGVAHATVETECEPCVAATSDPCGMRAPSRPVVSTHRH